MSDINYRLGLAVRRADRKFEQAGGDTTAQWIPFFTQELEIVGLEICPTMRTTDGANLREDNIVLQNIGGGSFREVPAKTPSRKAYERKSNMGWIIVKSAGDEFSFSEMSVPYKDIGYTYEYAKGLADSITSAMKVAQHSAQDDDVCPDCGSSDGWHKMDCKISPGPIQT